MPKIKTVKSLKQCCYRRIALSFDKYWMKDLDPGFHDLPRLLYVLGPFENLTSEMIQSLLETLVAEKCLKRQHFTIILQHSVTRLDLSSAGLAANNDAVVKTIMNQCSKLTFLSLQGLNNISARALADLVRQITSLRVLDLSRTGCNDQVLSVLGHNCLELSQLLIPYTKVTNCGAYSLCQSCSPEKGCKNLTKLSVFGTLIGTDGALHCLKNLPKLHYLGYDDICGVIELDVDEKLNRGQELKPYELRSIMTHGIEVHPASERSITLACQLCPKAVEAHLFYKISNENILAVKSLKHLTRLKIGSSHGLTFEGGVLPVLENIGHQLTELTLADVNDFDLLMLGHYCQNLQTLNILISDDNGMNLMKVSGAPSVGRGRLFNSLLSLEVTYPMLETDLHKTALVLLMKNAKELKHLALQYVSWMSTEVFQEILEENGMSKLQKCVFVFCNNIDGHVVKMLVYGQNDLMALKLYKCKNIGRQECEDLQKYAHKQNMDLEISWT